LTVERGPLRRLWARTELAVRVAIGSGAVLVLFGVLLIASLIRHDLAQARTALANELGHELALLATTLVEPVVVGDYTLIREMLTLRAKHPDVTRIAWTDTSSHVIETLNEDKRVLAPAWFTQLADVPDVEGEQAITVGGQPYGRVSLRVTAAAKLQEVWSAAVERTMSVAVGIGICLALTSWILLRGMLPFSELALAARRFGRGDYSLRMVVTGPPESRSCIDAFNRMGADIERLVESLKTAEANLQRSNLELEQRVASRTAELEQANRGLQAEVAERRLAEIALRMSEEHASRLARVVEQASDGIITRDMDGRITSWNAATARLFGIAASEAIGQPIGTLHQSNFSADEAATILARIREGASHTFEADRIDRDGRLIHLHVAASPIFDTTGVQCGEMSVIRDITERKVVEQETARAREAAEAANRSKSQFLANMSHEIRTPMNGVLGMAELLLGTQLDASQEKFALAIHRSGTALLHLINDILDYSKIESGHLELEHVGFALRELVGDVVELLSESAHAKELSLSFAVADGVPNILVGDPLRLRQIITNLTGNALKFTEAGSVSLEITRCSDTSALQLENHAVAEPETIELMFAVRDTGIGIPANAMDRLFSQFSQADGSTTRRFGGSGLGLAISKQLAESMGGRIGVESEVGRGSRFWFTVRMEVGNSESVLVKDVGHDMAHVPSSIGVGFLEVTRRKRVLLAEDNPINRQIATVMLESFGCDVVVAVDGRQAIDRSRVQPFDLILMDCQMPEVDGFEATVTIRAHEASIERAATRADPTLRRASRTPIIALTANAMQGDRERCIEAGMDDYLAKPFAKKSLRAVIDRWVAAIGESKNVATSV
jgi:PAS domain S-box-containing protein